MSVSLPAAFGLDPDQSALRQSVRSALARHCPTTRVRALMGRALPDPALWRQLVAVGLPGALVPEDLGGAGLDVVDVVVALEETGAALVPSPHLSVLLATAVLRALPDRAAQAGHLADLAAGRLVASLALAEQGSWRPRGLQTRAVPDGRGGWRLTGAKELALDAAGAGLLLVSAATDDGPALFSVPAGQPGVALTPVPTLDQTRALADVRLAAAAGTRLGGVAEVEAALDLGVVLLSAEQVGAAQRVLDMSVAHARTRTQYGRAIGSFQAVKHALADVLIEVEYARAAVHYAAWAATDGPAELAQVVGVLRSTVSPALSLAASTAVQVHGGTGFTWEHDCHLYDKRAIGDALLLGSTTEHQDRLADLLGIGPGGGTTGP